MSKDKDQAIGLNNQQKKILARIQADFNQLIKSGVGLICDQYGDFIYAINLKNVAKVWSNDDICFEDDDNDLNIIDIDVTYRSDDFEPINIPFEATLDINDTSFGIQFKENKNGKTKSTSRRKKRNN